VAPTARPSLATPSLFSAVWWTSVLVGWGLVAVGAYQVAAAPMHAAAPLAMTMVLVMVLELRPLVQGRGHDPQGVVMSIAFVIAILFLWGPWPAMVAVSIATLASGLRVRKSIWKNLFNVGQYNLCLGAAWFVMLIAGHNPSIEHPLRDLHGSDVLWTVIAWTVYFLLNDVLVSAALAHTDSFGAMIRYDFVHYATTTFSVLALSPLIVVVAQTSWTLLPLLLIPLLLVYKMAQMSLEREHQAGHDTLTGLPNRKNLRLSLEEALVRADRDERPVGLLLIDMDHFKEVNDTLGHQVGDNLLIQFARRLTASVRVGDQAARLGGDEFAVIVPGADVATAISVGERIQAALGAPMDLEGVRLDIAASIGLAMYPAHARSADDLLRLADIAMYTAKDTRSRIATYSPERDGNSSERLQLIGELTASLEDGSLDLYYQPKVSLADGSVLGVEAMLRWRHPRRGLIPPDQFIPIAERSGIMPALTERVIMMALEQIALWRATGLHLPVAVNISPTDLTSGSLIAVIAAGLHAHKVPPGLLQLEVTERVLSEETPDLNRALVGLDTLGVTLSLDDFGTGYSSLLRLKSLPIRELKIDREFVSALNEDAAARGIVRTVIELAHVLNMPAIAEGVETAEELDCLRALGCDGAQGWHIAPPMPRESLTTWLAQYAAAANANNPTDPTGTPDPTGTALAGPVRP
jgi:diguanylate cyclase (GGDEF)-like protein